MNATGLYEQRPDAVVWLDAGHAIVAMRDPAGAIATVEINRRHQAEPRYLAAVVHEVGDHQRVMLIGPEPLRLALERRFVAVTHRPDRLVAAGPRARSAESALIGEPAALAA